jgi:hypothetical protein
MVHASWFMLHISDFAFPTSHFRLHISDFATEDKQRLEPLANAKVDAILSIIIDGIIHPNLP